MQEKTDSLDTIQELLQAWPELISTNGIIRHLKKYGDLKLCLTVRNYLQSSKYLHTYKYQAFDIGQSISKFFSQFRNSQLNDSVIKSDSKSQLIYVTHSEEYNNLNKALDEEIAALQKLQPKMQLSWLPSFQSLQTIFQHLCNVGFKNKTALIIGSLLIFSIKPTGAKNTDDGYKLARKDEKLVPDPVTIISPYSYQDFLNSEEEVVTDLTQQFIQKGISTNVYSIILNKAIEENMVDLVRKFGNDLRLHAPNPTLLIEGPLHVACRKGLPAIVELLVSYGVDVNAYGIDGTTPLIEAAVNGNEEIVRHLLNNGAKPFLLRSDEHSPLTLALHHNHFSIAKLIYEYKSNNVLDAELYQLLSTVYSSVKSAKTPIISNYDFLVSIDESVDKLISHLDKAEHTEAVNDLLGFAHVQKCFSFIQKDAKRAISELELALKYAVPKLSYYRYYLQLVVKQIADLNETQYLQDANFYLKKALDYYPDNEHLLFYKMNLLHAQGKSEEVAEIAKQLINKNTIYIYPYIILGNYYYKKLQFKEAKKIFSMGLELDPTNKEIADVHDHLGYYTSDKNTLSYVLTHPINVYHQNEFDYLCDSNFCPTSTSNLFNLDGNHVFNYKKINSIFSLAELAMKNQQYDKGIKLLNEILKELDYEVILKSVTSNWQKGKLYLRKVGENIEYTVLDLNDNPIMDIITQEEFEYKLPETFTLQSIRPYLPEIFKITSERNHTYVMPCNNPYFNLQIAKLYDHIGTAYFESRSNFELAKKNLEIAISLLPNKNYRHVSIGTFYAYSLTLKQMSFLNQAHDFITMVIDMCRETRTKNNACVDLEYLSTIKREIEFDRMGRLGFILNYWLDHPYHFSFFSVCAAFFYWRFFTDSFTATNQQNPNENQSALAIAIAFIAWFLFFKKTPRVTQTIPVAEVVDQNEKIQNEKDLKDLLSNFKDVLNIEDKKSCYIISVNSTITLAVPSNLNSGVSHVSINSAAFYQAIIDIINEIYSLDKPASLSEDGKYVVMKKTDTTLTTKTIKTYRKNLLTLLIQDNDEYKTKLYERTYQGMVANCEKYLNDQVRIYKDFKESIASIKAKLGLAVKYINSAPVTKSSSATIVKLNGWLEEIKTKNIILDKLEEVILENNYLIEINHGAKLNDHALIVANFNPSANNNISNNNTSENSMVSNVINTTNKLVQLIKIATTPATTIPDSNSFNTIAADILSLRATLKTLFSKQIEEINSHFDRKFNPLKRELQTIIKQEDKYKQHLFDIVFNNVISTIEKQISEKVKKEEERAKKERSDKWRKQLKQEAHKTNKIAVTKPFSGITLEKNLDKKFTSSCNSYHAEMSSFDKNLLKTAIDHYDLLGDLIAHRNDEELKKIKLIIMNEGLQDCIFKIMRALSIARKNIKALDELVEESLTYSKIANRILHYNYDIATEEELLNAATYLKFYLDKPLKELSAGKELSLIPQNKLRSSFLASNINKIDEPISNYLTSSKFSIVNQIYFIRCYLKLMQEQAFSKDLLETALQSSLHIIRKKSHGDQTVESLLRKYKLIDNKLFFIENSMSIAEIDKLQNFCEDFDDYANKGNKIVSKCDSPVKVLHLFEENNDIRILHHSLKSLSEPSDFAKIEDDYAKTALRTMLRLLNDLVELSKYSITIRAKHYMLYFNNGRLHCAMKMLTCKIGQIIKDLPTKYRRGIYEMTPKDLLITEKQITLFEYYREQFSHSFTDDTDINNNSIYFTFEEITAEQLYGLAKQADGFYSTILLFSQNKGWSLENNFTTLLVSQHMGLRS